MLSGSAFVQQAKLTASDGAASADFGNAVAVSGNTMVVGAYEATVGGIKQGAAYVFTESGSTWTQTAELTASDGAAGNYFGVSVAIDGTTVVVGASGATVGGIKQGAAYVFTESGSTWTQAAELTPSDGTAGEGFGGSDSISGTTMVVGAGGATLGGIKQGAAYVFTESDSTWTQAAELTASDGAAGNSFGYSVAISADDTIVVGARSATVGGNANQGAAYVFTESGSAWTQTANLTASDGLAQDRFGESVAIDSETDTVVVGAQYDMVGGNYQQGAAYVFTEPSGGWADMTQTAKLTASDGLAQDWFGQSVSISGNTVVVGAYGATVGGNNLQGAAYVFTEPTLGWSGNLTQSVKLTASDGAAGNYFGVSVAVSGNTVVVGAYRATVGGDAAQGAAYVFGSAPVGLSLTGLRPDDTNLAYNQTIVALGGTGTVTLKVSNIKNAIPGLTVPAGGISSLTISGTPTATGNETFTITATDPAGDTASATYSIWVNPALTFGTTLPAGTVNVEYGQLIPTSGGTVPLTFVTSNVKNAIPGLTVNNGAIVGIPTATGTEVFTVTATDAVGATATQTYFLTVTGPSAVTSSNWSGYAVTTGAGAVTDVKGSWIEPTLHSPSAANTYSAFWVGIDGYSSGTVEQIGTDLDTNASGKAVYYAWYEMYPSSPVNLSMKINPGDQISAEVKYTGSNKFTLTLTDVTTNTTFSTSQTLKSAKLSSAEWIAEAPSSSRGVLPLADFGAVSFSGASATISGTTGPIDNKSWPSGNPISITMVGSSGTEAYPSSLVDSAGTSAFSVSFAGAQGAGMMASQGANGAQEKPAQAAAYLQYEAQLPSQPSDSERSLAIRAVDLVLMEFSV
ncbi:MAG: G1 family glutamic endopeptidase [Thermoguttaceae bacterium]